MGLRGTFVRWPGRAGWRSRLSACYDGIGHVTMYVGGGYMIDAPQTGMDVQKIPMDTGWDTSTFVGAARP